MTEPGEIGWETTVRRVVASWLFSDLTADALPSTGILPLENPDLHDHEATCDPLDERRAHRTLTTGAFGDVPLSVFRPKLGGPAAAMLVDAAADRGLRALVAVGYCGGLVREYRTGELVVVSRALGDDGTGEAYGTDHPPVPAPRVQSLLLERLEAAEVRWREGPAWSTDAVLLEDDRRIEEWRNAGAVAVDMETRAVLAAAGRSGVEACVLLVVSDNPAAGRVADRERLTRGWKTALSVAFDVASRAGRRES